MKKENKEFLNIYIFRYSSRPFTTPTLFLKK